MSSSPTPEQLQAEFAQLYPEAPAPEEPAPAPEVPPADAAAAPAPKPVAKPGPVLQPEPPFGATLVDFATRGFHVDISIPAADVVAVAERLYAQEFTLDTITGVDWQKLEQMEVVYDYLHFSNGLRVVVRCRVPRAEPELPTISHIYQGANWHERETHDFFGIRFSGHNNLTPFLLPEDATYHPLRKDFTGAPE